MHGYNAAKIFVEVVKRAGGKTDQAAIVAALEGMTDLDTGLMAPLSSPRTSMPAACRSRS